MLLDAAVGIHVDSAELKGACSSCPGERDRAAPVVLVERMPLSLAPSAIANAVVLLVSTAMDLSRYSSVGGLREPWAALPLTRTILTSVIHQVAVRREQRGGNHDNAANRRDHQRRHASDVTRMIAWKERLATMLKRFIAHCPTLALCEEMGDDWLIATATRPQFEAAAMRLANAEQRWLLRRAAGTAADGGPPVVVWGSSDNAGAATGGVGRGHPPPPPPPSSAAVITTVLSSSTSRRSGGGVPSSLTDGPILSTMTPAFAGAGRRGPSLLGLDDDDVVEPPSRSSATKAQWEWAVQPMVVVRRLPYSVPRWILEAWLLASQIQWWLSGGCSRGWAEASSTEEGSPRDRDGSAANDDEQQQQDECRDDEFSPPSPSPITCADGRSEAFSTTGKVTLHFAPSLTRGHLMGVNSSRNHLSGGGGCGAAPPSSLSGRRARHWTFCSPVSVLEELFACHRNAHDMMEGPSPTTVTNTTTTHNAVGGGETRRSSERRGSRRASNSSPLLTNDDRHFRCSTVASRGFLSRLSQAWESNHCSPWDLVSMARQEADLVAAEEESKKKKMMMTSPHTSAASSNSPIVNNNGVVVIVARPSVASNPATGATQMACDGRGDDDSVVSPPVAPGSARSKGVFGSNLVLRGAPSAEVAPVVVGATTPSKATSTGADTTAGRVVERMRTDVGAAREPLRMSRGLSGGLLDDDHHHAGRETPLMRRASVLTAGSTRSTVNSTDDGTASSRRPLVVHSLIRNTPPSATAEVPKNRRHPLRRGSTSSSPLTTTTPSAPKWWSTVLPSLLMFPGTVDLRIREGGGRRRATAAATIMGEGDHPEGEATSDDAGRRANQEAEPAVTYVLNTLPVVLTLRCALAFDAWRFSCSETAEAGPNEGAAPSRDQGEPCDAGVMQSAAPLPAPPSSLPSHVDRWLNTYEAPLIEGILADDVVTDTGQVTGGEKQTGDGDAW